MSASTPRRPVKLTSWTRWVLVIFGIAGMGGGSVAIFMRNVEAGPAVMIGIGAFFFLFGIAGFMPTRLKLGANEAEWQAVTDFVEETVEDAPAEDRPEIIRRLNDLSKAIPEAAAPALTGMLYEQQVLEMIREIAHDLRPQIRTESQVGPGARFDMYVTGPAGQKIAIEIRSGLRSFASYRELYGRFSHLKEELGLGHFLIVTAERPGSSVTAFMAALEDASLVPVRGYEDMPLLRQELIRLVGPVEQ